MPFAVLRQQNRDLIAAGFQESSFQMMFLYVKDPLLGKFFRKKVTLVQLGMKPVVPLEPAGEDEWQVEDSTEFSAFLTKEIFDKENWADYVKGCRRTIPHTIRSLHTELTVDICIFSAWRKLDNGTHRATFRAPTKHMKIILESSGISGPFFVQVFCRAEEDKKERAASTTVQWLPKKTHADALVLIRSFAQHQGLVFSGGTFGIRVPVTALAAAREAVASKDPRYADSNRGIVGRNRYEVIGLPCGRTHKDIISHFSKWKSGWHVVPQKQIVTADGEVTWYVVADVNPPDRYYETKEVRVR